MGSEIEWDAISEIASVGEARDCVGMALTDQLRVAYLDIARVG